MKSLLRSTAAACCLAVSITGVAACGSSSKSASSTNTTAAKASTNTAMGTSTPSTVKSSGGGTFCTKAAADYNASMASVQSTTGVPTPAQFQQTIEKARQANIELERQAPPAIRRDIRLVVAASTQFYDTIASSNYDMTKVPAGSLSKARLAMTSAEVVAASARLTAYLKNTCGINLGIPAPTTTAP